MSHFLSAGKQVHSFLFFFLFLSELGFLAADFFLSFSL